MEEIVSASDSSDGDPSARKLQIHYRLSKRKIRAARWRLSKEAFDLLMDRQSTCRTFTEHFEVTDDTTDQLSVEELFSSAWRHWPVRRLDGSPFGYVEFGKPALVSIHSSGGGKPTYSADLEDSFWDKNIFRAPVAVTIHVHPDLRAYATYVTLCVWLQVTDFWTRNNLITDSDLEDLQSDDEPDISEPFEWAFLPGRKTTVTFY